MDPIIADIQKLIADLESKSYFAAAADIGKLIADGVPFLESLFNAPNSVVKAEAHAPVTMDEAKAKLQAVVDAGKINWTTLIPLLLQIGQLLLPLLAKTA